MFELMIEAPTTKNTSRSPVSEAKDLALPSVLSTEDRTAKQEAGRIPESPPRAGVSDASRQVHVKKSKPSVYCISKHLYEQVPHRLLFLDNPQLLDHLLAPLKRHRLYM
jgi:hypothetical protein